MMIVKPRTSREILAEDYEWPMTAGKVSKLTGVTVRTLRHYDKKGLLKVARTGETVANDRKLYYPEDVERLKRILVLTTYGFSLDEVAVILDNDLSVTDVLGLRLEELHRQERRIRNLILFAHFAALVGDDVFETLAFGTSDIDAYADAMRETASYQAYLAYQAGLSEEERDALWSRYCDIVESFLDIDGELSFAALEMLVGRLRQWFCGAFYPIEEGELLSLWTLFADGVDAAELAEEIGGEGTAGFLQATVFFVWAKRTLTGLAQVLDAHGAAEEETAAVARYIFDETGLLAGEAALLMDERERYEFCATILGYLEDLLRDSDALEILELGERADDDVARLAQVRVSLEELVQTA